MSRTDRKGKRVGGPAFVQIFHWIRQTEAWRSLGPYSRLLYIEIRARYTGSNNGDISMSYREAEELLNCSNRPVPVAFAELQDRGFIVATQKGSFDWKVRFTGKGRATTWRLTELPADWPERSLTPTLDFKTWTPPATAEKKTRHAKCRPMARKLRAIDDGMARKKRAIGTQNVGHSDRFGAVDGTQNVGTIRSTIPLPATVPIGQAASRALLNSRILKNAQEEARQARKNGAAK